MENKEKEYIKLRFALSFKKVLQENKSKGLANKKDGIKNRNLIDSYAKWETASGVPKASLLAIIQGKKNAASTTIAMLVEALELTLSGFGAYYDSVTEKEVWAYKASLQKTKEERSKKRLSRKRVR